VARMPKYEKIRNAREQQYKPQIVRASISPLFESIAKPSLADAIGGFNKLKTDINALANTTK
jgi:hypothetical protein